MPDLDRQVLFGNEAFIIGVLQVVSGAAAVGTISQIDKLIELAGRNSVLAFITLMVATLIFGGILEKCPNLRACIAHGGGPACFGMGRLDRGWQVRSEAREHISKPPSTYQRKLYYDFLTSSEPALRFLIDTVGADRVVVGSDWPFVAWDPSPSGWLEGLQSLSTEEKERISWKNLEELLGI